MTEDYEYDYQDGPVSEVPAPQPEPEEVKVEAPSSKPAWSLGRNGYVAYGDEGAEVDYINAVFGINAASFTKATEEAVAEYRKRRSGTPGKFVGYHTYKSL